MEYEEVILSDIDDDDDDVPSPKACCSSVKVKPINPSTIEIKYDKPSPSFSDRCTSVDIQKLTEKPLKKIVRKPARPIRLFSFTDHDIIHKFSLADPVKKNITLQLLDIVKSVNLRRRLKVEKNGSVVPNFYIMATKRDLEDSTRKVISMKSTDIVKLIKEVVHMIKTCVYREVDDIEIICDSPAIFLIKYVNVKDWDSGMNAVYVVTSEYLLPYLCKIRAAEEQEKSSKMIAANILKSGPIKRKQTMEPVQVKKPKTVINEFEPNEQDPLIVPYVQNDEGIIENILSKYLELDAVDFFLSQMKTVGKVSSRFRWSDKDKFFALNLLRKNPTEYSILYEKYNLPSDKTIDKFLKNLQHERIDDIQIDE